MVQNVSSNKRKDKENATKNKRRLKFPKMNPRQEELAKPKINFEEYNNKFSPFPKVNANNQEMIYPIPMTALTYTATDRINQLAKPRMPDFTPHSILDKNGKPAEFREVQRSALEHEASRRLKQLAKPASRYMAAPDIKWRYEMVGHVQSGALLYRISDRIRKLSKRKTESIEHMWESCGPYPLECRSNPYNPAHDALLARPKRFWEPPFDHDQWVKDRIKRATQHHTTDRENFLSVPFAKNYWVNTRHPREVYSIPRRALKHQPTPGDIKRSTHKVPSPTTWERDYNPEAFVITPIMLRAICSKRTDELSEPKAGATNIC